MRSNQSQVGQWSHSAPVPSNPERATTHTQHPQYRTLNHERRPPCRGTTLAVLCSNGCSRQTARAIVVVGAGSSESRGVGGSRVESSKPRPLEKASTPQRNAAACVPSKADLSALLLRFAATTGPPRRWRESLGERACGGGDGIAAAPEKRERLGTSPIILTDPSRPARPPQQSGRTPACSPGQPHGSPLLSILSRIQRRSVSPLVSRP